MKGCVQCNSVHSREDFASSGDQTRSTRSVGQRLTHGATRAPQKKWRVGGEGEGEGVVTLKNLNTEMPISCTLDEGTLFEYNVYLMLK